MTSIAEGVETEEQFRELIALDCHLAQGFLWSPAVEADEATEVRECVGKVTHSGHINIQD